MCRQCTCINTHSPCVCMLFFFLFTTRDLTNLLPPPLQISIQSEITSWLPLKKNLSICQAPDRSKTGKLYFTAGFHCGGRAPLPRHSSREVPSRLQGAMPSNATLQARPLARPAAMPRQSGWRSRGGACEGGEFVAQACSR